jgi:tRNA modification GTPase
MRKPRPDTIVAIATPPGRGGIGVVRVSGPRVPRIAAKLLGTLPEPRFATRARFRDARGRALDRGLALYFPAPNSYTGDAVLELHGHGGPVLLDALVARICRLGARPAGPGEFTQRAYLNGKLDLAQAEAVADLIEAGSEAAARAAARSLEGAFSRQVTALDERLAALRGFVEAALDFPTEELDFMSEAGVAGQVEALGETLIALRARARQGSRLREGMNIAIAGRPNAGKSSLLNLLTGSDAAIVTAVPGTTRDLLRERVHLDGMPLHLVDTAGLRAAHERDRADAVEHEGMRRAKAEFARADRVLLVVADDTPDAEVAALRAELPAGVPVTLVRNKIDLSGAPAGVVEEGADRQAVVRLSALTGEGLDGLREHLKAAAGYAPVGEDQVSARRRHLEALDRAAAHLATARQHAELRAGELVAEELKLAHDALGSIVGATSSDALLGQIFGSMCIGK